MTMRRKDREITDPAGIETIIRACRYCRLAMCLDNRPYVVPLSFGYRDRSVFFHSAHHGHKLDILQKNPRVCVEFDTGCTLRTGDKPCNWGFAYQSVIGSGTAVFLESPAEKQDGLAVILQQVSAPPYRFSEAELQTVVVFRVDLEEISGKQAWSR